MTPEHDSLPPELPIPPSPYRVSGRIDTPPPARLRSTTPHTRRFLGVVSIGLSAFLVGGAGVAVAAIALAPLGAAIGSILYASVAADVGFAAGSPAATVSPRH
jgi:hypothetical protein